MGWPHALQIGCDDIDIFGYSLTSQPASGPRLFLSIEVEVCGCAANFHFDTLVVSDLRRYKTAPIFND